MKEIYEVNHYFEIPAHKYAAKLYPNDESKFLVAKKAFMRGIYYFQTLETQLKHN